MARCAEKKACPGAEHTGAGAWSRPTARASLYGPSLLGISEAQVALVESVGVSFPYPQNKTKPIGGKAFAVLRVKTQRQTCLQ